MIVNPGLIRPEGENVGTTCYFRNVELDETILALLGDGPATVLFQADSIGAGATSFRILRDMYGKDIVVKSRDIMYGAYGNLREPCPIKYDVVYALNVFLYIPVEEHPEVVKTIASYNTKYLCVTHIQRHLLDPYYTPVKDNHKRISENWRHAQGGVKDESFYIWERK